MISLEIHTECRKFKKEKKNEIKDFVQNQYKFTKAALEGEKTGALRDTKKEKEEHLSQSHLDAQRDEPLGECSRVPKVETPATLLDNKERT